YTAKTAVAPLDIWPTENEVDLEVQQFVDAKLRRDQSGAPIMERYHYLQYGDEYKKVFVKGRPSLGGITTIMVGVRNEMRGDAKDLVLWDNEIRLADVE